MAIQERNSEMVSLLSVDFIQKTDTVYLAGIAAGSILMLPGLVAFWPMGIVVNDSTAWTTASWAKALELAVGSAVQWLKGATSFSRGIGYTTDGNLYLIRSSADDNSAAAIYDLIVDNSGNFNFLGTIKTAAGNAWNLGAYTTSAPSATGYVTVNIDGTPYKFLVSNV
jgi:hypothetical protein